MITLLSYIKKSNLIVNEMSQPANVKHYLCWLKMNKRDWVRQNRSEEILTFQGEFPDRKWGNKSRIQALKRGLQPASLRMNQPSIQHA